VSAVLIVVIAIACVAAGLAAGWWLPPHGRKPRAERRPAVRQILLPFTGTAISRRALDAAVRLARVDGATLMPAYLLRVPLHLPLDAPLPASCDDAMPLLEAIDQRASAQGVTVDARIMRGRSYRDALRRLLDSEQFERVIVPADSSSQTGLSAEDIAWLLDRVPAEVLILRASPEDHRQVSAGALAGHF
jgi:nucleotide-binding universal stress UspA family protein